jgi:hypothetical protein
MAYFEVLVVGLMILGALGYLGRYTWRMWRGRQSGCGCGSSGSCSKAQSESADNS